MSNRYNIYMFMIFFYGLCFTIPAQNHKLDIPVPQNGHTINTINLSGYLDSYNTISRKNFWSDLERNFEPLQKITICNNSKKTINSPRIIVNNKNYYDEQKMLSDILASSNSLQDTLFSIYLFVNDNIVHNWHGDWEAYTDRYKALFVYGYALCSSHAIHICNMLQTIGISSEEIRMPYHNTMQAVADGKSFLLDADEVAFYKNLDNNEIAGLNDVLNDKFLIQRTKRLGKAEYESSLFTSLIYDAPYTTTAFSKLQPYQYDFTLKPGEKIIFDYSCPTLFHQLNDRLVDYGNVFVEFEEVKELISNSLYSYNQNFLNVDLKEILSDTLNVITSIEDSLPNLHARNTDVAEFTVKFDLPFPVLDINIKTQLKQATLADSILIYYSTDNTNWKYIYTSQQTGSFTDSINLYEEVAPLEKDALYNYFLKFQFNPNDSAWACGIDSLEVNTTFQCSRFFLPKLKLGENIIEYTDANGDDPDRNVEVTVEWQESWENRPPNKVQAPIFPLHQAEVDSLYFAFTWEPAIDEDGDEIADYEFMLSGDDRMLYPYSPNFSLYVSAFGEKAIRPYFKVKETGWLSDGQTYYWRVRAKDTRGAWGEWSDTWSFTPHGVMRPVDAKAEIKEQSILLSWEQNPTGKQPDFYKIYASDEMNGFTPGESTFFAVADTTEFVIPFNKKIAPYSFYRIAACDRSGQESLISNAIALPYPYIYSAYDSIRTNEVFRLNLLSNQRFYPYIHYDYGEDVYIPTITILEKPEWLIQQSQNVLYSDDVMLARRMLYQDPIQCSVLVLLEDDWGNWKEQRLFLHTTATNNKPALALSDSILCEGNFFWTYITSTDGDVAFGDTNYYTILEKPTWLNCDIKGDTIHLSANGLTFQDSLLRVLAVDTKGESTTSEFRIYFKPYEDITTTVSQVFKSSPSLYYAKVDPGKEIEFRYNLYSANGATLFSSSNYNLMNGTYCLPINMAQYPDGVYIFAGFENNQKCYSIKFIKK